MAGNGVRHGRHKRRQARLLRSEGKSVKWIARRLQVAPSTVSLWVRQVALTDLQIEALGRANVVNGEAAGARSTTARLARETAWRQQARELWGLHSGDPLWSLGIGLYLGEGTKATRMLALTNADPRIVKLWVRWCRRFIPQVALRALVTYPENVQPEVAVAFWEKELDVAGIKAYPNRKQPRPAARRTRLLEYGTIQVCVCKGSAQWWTMMMEFIRLADESTVGSVGPVV